MVIFYSIGISHAAEIGEKVAQPKRIISLKPNITEILFALGVGDKVVGVTTWCDYPAEAKKLPKVADYISINSEKVIALEPDLVIGSKENSLKGEFGVLKNAHIDTLLLSFRTIDEMYDSIEKMAEAVGKKEAGKNLVTDMRAVIASVAKRSPESTQGTATPPSVARNDSNLRTYALTHLRTLLILVGHRPLVAAGDNTFFGGIIKAIGAANIVEGNTPYPTINTEFILAKGPDIIIDLGMGSEETLDLPEIIKKKVVRLDMSDFRAGPRLGNAIEKLALSLRVTK